MAAHLPPTWNESLLGPYLWSNVNFGEAVSEVMTPLTWSLLHTWRAQWPAFDGLPPFGNLGGRLYLNVSYFASALALAGQRGPAARLALEAMLHMPLPPGLELPIISAGPGAKLAFLARWVMAEARWRQTVAALPRFIAANPAWCQAQRQAIAAAPAPAELARLWTAELLPRAAAAYLGTLATAMQFGQAAGRLHQALTRRVGRADADLLTNHGAALASLGPVLGLARLARGELTPAAYTELYGHRGPNEWELYTPRPAEDPAWLAARQAEYRQAPLAPEQRLLLQEHHRALAWQRLVDPHGTLSRVRTALPSAYWRRRLAQVAHQGRLREAARSELVRVIAVLRACALRAGALAGLGDSVFFLAHAELAQVLAGDAAAARPAAERRALYRRLAALPAYPALIHAPFDPFHPPAPAPLAASPTPRRITGAPASAGCVEGPVRVIASLAEAGQLQPGEVLVAVLTDIGWTPFFPRAAAVVTDVGAALSHAAIVARELGLPAVVGCGDATRRLRTGDRVRVDGALGVVEVVNDSTEL